MKLTDETAEKLAEALNNLSVSLDNFTSIHADGIRLSELTHKTLNKLNDSIKNLNQENG
ncbi:hypothetical protein [Mariniflexile sp. AS56]|uniref:hypothetical protein n=1 Tax=Mariniflexile sp. AS56 TaxID=3063957 RepID=UPI0026EA1BF8|nr:hypothetical protein [Mariniflexile sp. AS56]MDO7174254.1 hypothetical protein [Mariniflexile sp. AS56]